MKITHKTLAPYVRDEKNRWKVESNIAPSFLLFSLGIFLALVYCFADAGRNKSGLGGSEPYESANTLDADGLPFVSRCIKVADRTYECGNREAITKWRAYEKNTFKATVTAYNSIPEQTDGSPCIAADGTDICRLERLGLHSCATWRVPLGTTIRIHGYGDCVVHDRTARKYGDRIDIYFGGADKILEAKAFGKKTLEVTIL